MDYKERIAKRVAQEMQNGFLINLGIGLPTLVSNYIEDKEVFLQSENGMVNMGAIQDPVEDLDICNAGGQAVYALPGAAFFDSALSFTIIRGGHVDVSVLGAYEVDEEASIASYIIPGKTIAGMGGAMDLLIGSRKIIVAMLHTNKGKIKIVKKCSLPITAKSKVHQIVTEMAVFMYDDGGLVLTERFGDFSLNDIMRATGAHFRVADDLKILGVGVDP